jgi:hypothetical protein
MRGADRRPARHPILRAVADVAYRPRPAHDRGTGLLYCTDEDEDADFAAVTAAGAAEDLETFRAHCARTREIMAAHELDDTFGKTNAYTLRWFYLYLIKEYARHLGHADLLRERIDGVTGE